jgi:hypothetical protein
MQLKVKQKTQSNFSNVEADALREREELVFDVMNF